MTNPHEHCGAAWRHLRDTLIAILGDRLPENPRGYSDADIHNAVRELVDDVAALRAMNWTPPYPAPPGYHWESMHCHGGCSNPECDGWVLLCDDESCSVDHHEVSQSA